MTRELLEELGGCYDYVSKFNRLFPISDYPDGVDINEETCRENARDFPWDWAVETMLDDDQGYSEYNRALREINDEYQAHSQAHQQRLEAWRSEYNETYLEPSYRTPQGARDAYQAITTQYNDEVTARGFSGNARSARAFGRTFDQHPEFRSRKVLDAQERAIIKLETQWINRHEDTVGALTSARQYLAQYAERVPQLEAEEIALRERAATARANVAKREAELAEVRAAEAQQLADQAKERAELAKTKAAELRTAAENVNGQSETPAETETGESAQSAAENSDSTTNESETVTTNA